MNKNEPYVNPFKAKGQKSGWQKYPAIVAGTMEYALVAIDESKGYIITPNGEKISEGKIKSLLKDFPKLDFIDEPIFSRIDAAMYWFWYENQPDLMQIRDIFEENRKDK